MEGRHRHPRKRYFNLHPRQVFFRCSGGNPHIATNSGQISFQDRPSHRIGATMEEREREQRPREWYRVDCSRSTRPETKLHFPPRVSTSLASFRLNKPRPFTAVNDHLFYLGFVFLPAIDHRCFRKPRNFHLPNPCILTRTLRLRFRK